jgi:DNA replication protein DnaC
MFRRMRGIVWHGTRQESLELLHAVRQHCTCEVEQGRMLAMCAAHRMLARDQRAVDGLLFMRRMTERLLAEEFDFNPSETQARTSRASSVSSAILT